MIVNEAERLKCVVQAFGNLSSARFSLRSPYKEILSPLTFPTGSKAPYSVESLEVQESLITEEQRSSQVLGKEKLSDAEREYYISWLEFIPTARQTKLKAATEEFKHTLELCKQIAAIQLKLRGGEHGS